MQRLLPGWKRDHLFPRGTKSGESVEKTSFSWRTGYFPWVGDERKLELDIYLDELDNRSSDMSGATGNGFTEERKILDFPVRDHKTILHIRRRRWLMPDGSSRIVNLEDKFQLAYPGTRYAKDFALFLTQIGH